MKLQVLAALTLIAVISARAHSPETAIVAAMQLAEKANYSWTCTITDDAQTYDIEGKTHFGYTWQRQPMPKTIARRLGREGGRDLEAIFSAPLQYVIRTENGWRNLEKLPKRHDDWNDDQWYYVSVPMPMTIMRGPDMPADASQIDPFGLPPAIYVPVLVDDKADDGKVYSNAQFALALPHEELAIIVSSHSNFDVDGDIVMGTLTDLGAQLLLVHDGHEYIKPVAAGGRFKLWLNRGSVQKYLVELAGLVVVERKAIYVRQKATTVIRDVGTTLFEVPADARRRL